MGREAITLCSTGALQEVLKALLESTELVLRGSVIRRRWPIGTLTNVAPAGDALCFTADGEQVTLQLGSKEAAAWARKIAEPPPSLAQKLGLDTNMPALVLGVVDDETLRSALENVTTPDAARAGLIVAIVRDANDLETAFAQHARMHCRHVWMIHRKGKGAHLGDTAIRATCRSRGYIDTKTCAVSKDWTATRYSAATTTSVPP